MLSDADFDLWGELLLRKQRAGTAAPPGDKVWLSPGDIQEIQDRIGNPFYDCLKTILHAEEIKEIAASPETMVKLGPLIIKFNQYVADERKRLSAASAASAASAGGGAARALVAKEVSDADSESKIAGKAVAIVADCGDDAVSVGDGESDMEEGYDAAAERDKSHGGKSRSRKRSVAKRTRRKGAAKKQKSKKNKRQSRRKSRRSSSRNSRK
jgi:hypothetical protein